MIGYLTVPALTELIGINAAHCLYSTSSTYEHLGNVTAVYFFDAAWQEIAHQTTMDDKNEFIAYERTWGGII